MREMAATGYRAEDIGREFGVSTGTVYAYTCDVRRRRSRRAPYRENGLGRPARPRNPVREARIIAACETDTLQAIADREGITRERVRQIVATYIRRTGHEIRLRTSGNSPRRAALPPTVTQRLLRLARLQPETGCWIWHGYKASLGSWLHPRPLFSMRGGRAPRLAYRVAFTLWRDPSLGTAQIVPQTCGDYSCINPFHWERRVNSR